MPDCGDLHAAPSGRVPDAVPGWPLLPVQRVVCPNGISDNIKRKPISTKFRGNFAAATADNNPDSTTNEVDPIQTNTTDSKYFLDNDDAIIFDLNRKKDNN